MTMQNHPHVSSDRTRTGSNRPQYGMGGAVEMNPAFLRSIGDWRAAGHHGLRIARCPACGRASRSSWDDLEADLAEDIVSVAFRMRCSACGKPPAGLAVTAYTERTIEDALGPSIPMNS